MADEPREAREEARRSAASAAALSALGSEEIASAMTCWAARAGIAAECGSGGMSEGYQRGTAGRGEVPNQAWG